MAKIELLMPKMGESITEATILKWVKKQGEAISVDETILEIATDKVDTDIPSPVSGVLIEVLYPEDSVVAVGEVIAIISTDGANETIVPSPAIKPAQSETKPDDTQEPAEVIETEVNELISQSTTDKVQKENESTLDDRFYSPLVKNMAKEENISNDELNTIVGTGANSRVTKNDMLGYLSSRNNIKKTIDPTPASVSPPSLSVTAHQPISNVVGGNIEIIEMDRMRKLIADHMVMSKQVSPHVTSFVEADVTNLFQWREKNKKKYQEVYGENITFTPLFIAAVVKAIKDYPMVNVSLDGHKIIVKKDINIGMAAALPSGNLIVPVIKNADYLSLSGLTKTVNDLANRARNNKLKPEEIKDGTFTVTNVGTFGNVMGTPIINQPQVAILALGAIRKKPAVLETEFGDVIAIRQMMFLSLSYDHRVVDGSLGGSFLRRIADYLEKFDPSTTI